MSAIDSEQSEVFSLLLSFQADKGHTNEEGP